MQGSQVLRKDSLVIKAFIIFVIFQPFYDILLYFLNSVLSFNHVVISLIRPLLALSAYMFLLFSRKISFKLKAYSLTLMAMFAAYSILHLLNIKSYFYSGSYGSVLDEIRQTAVYGYYLLQFTNIYFLTKIANKKEWEKLQKAIVFAVFTISALHLLSVLTGTSPRTYGENSIKSGFKGWSVSVHYVGHTILISMPIILSVLFERKLVKSGMRFVFFLSVVISIFYILGTKAPAYGLLGFMVFYTLIKGLYLVIKKEKLTLDYSFVVILALVLVFTLPYTSARESLEHQISIFRRNTDLSTVSLIKGASRITEEDNLVQETQKSKPVIANGTIEETKAVEETTASEAVSIVEPRVPVPGEFEKRLLHSIKKVKDQSAHVIDNRQIQLKINMDLRSNSPLRDKLFGYGYYTMAKNTWVETDTMTLFFSYGVLGALLIVGVPLLMCLYWILRGLFHFRKMTPEAWIYAFGIALSTGVITFVGYTMLFAQTVFYLAVLQVFSIKEFRKVVLL
jgi:hypothetical protein